MQGQSETPSWSRLDWLPVAGAVLLALVVRLLAGPRTVDDAYITFRCTRNLAEGLGFVCNPGQSVLGTTTPFYTMSMSLQCAGVARGCIDSITEVAGYALRLPTFLNQPR